MEGGLESLIKLVYGSPLWLPWEFFTPSPTECTDITDFASQLRVHIGKLRPIQASRHAVQSTFIFKGLATPLHIFLWHGAFWGALHAPYVGPYWVLYRGNETYSTEVQGAAKRVSIDCLKLAYVLHVKRESSSPLAIPSSITTRSAWRVRFLDYLGVQWSQWWRWCGRLHWLAHPRSQNILPSIHHNLKNVETGS